MDIAKILGLNSDDVALLVDCALRATAAIESIANDIHEFRLYKDQGL